MSSISNISASTLMPIDLAKKIGISGINEILSVFWVAYNNLKTDINVSIDENTEEDDITIKWFEKIHYIWDSRNRATSIVLNTLHPINQYSDSTLKKRKGLKSPTIDFCFKDWETTSYFGAECKNLYQNNKTKVKRYIETGIGNYVTGRYGSQSTVNSVVGYLLSGSVSEIVKQLNTEMNQLNPPMNISRDMKYLQPQYISSHIRSIDDASIQLYHLFFDLTIGS